MRKMIALGCVLLLVGLLAGCGERTESSRYYYSPGWTRDGKIIMIGATQTVNKDILGGQLGSSYAEYILTIFPSGTGESAALFDVTGAPPYAMTCSPTRDYVGYLDELRGGEFGKVVIRSLSAEAHTGLREIQLSFYPKIKSFDWSNDGNKIVYCTSTEVRTRDWNDFTGASDQLVTAEAGLEFVSWKNGGRIAFIYTSGGSKRLALIYPDGSGRTDLAAGLTVEYPQISSANTNEVFGVAGPSLVKVDVNAAASTEVMAAFAGQLPRLSPDASLVTYDKAAQDSGVYVCRVATGTEEAVKR